MLKSSIALLCLVFSVNRQKFFVRIQYTFEKKINEFYSCVTCLLINCLTVYDFSINYILISNVFYLFDLIRPLHHLDFQAIVKLK